MDTIPKSIEDHNPDSLDLEYSKLDINKFEKLGIEIDPHKYDFVFSHIPVGKLMKISDHFNFKIIYDRKQKTSFYIHIPFCLKECVYCYFVKDFARNVRCSKTDTTPFPDNKYHSRSIFENENEWTEVKKEFPSLDRVGEYLYFLKMEFEIFQRHFSHWNEIDSIYIGGGTPSFLNMTELDYLFEHILKPLREQISNGARDHHIEIAMEIHPELMIENGKPDTRKLQKILDLGVNRLSFGIQTFDKELLTKICRTNIGYKELITSITHESNFDNWNLDMIYGLPYQNELSLVRDIKEVLELNPPSVTWYQLWYSPRKKDREIKLRMKEFEQHLPTKEEIIKFKLIIHEALTKNNYRNISGDWYVKEEKFYTKYEEYKVSAQGNVGIGIGIYQYYGDYVFENTSGNGYDDNLDWKEYYLKIWNKKLPISWIRKIDDNERYLRELVMGLKGMEVPVPIERNLIKKHFENNNSFNHIYKRIEQLIQNEIFFETAGKIYITDKYHILRDYIIIFLLEKYGWNIEKMGMLESLDGVDVFKAKDSYFPYNPKEFESIAFFASIFNELTGTYELNFSYNYIYSKNGFSRRKVSEDEPTRNDFSFLQLFYSQPFNLQTPVCIIKSEKGKDSFEFPTVKMDIDDNIFRENLKNFLSSTELSEKKPGAQLDYVKRYYSKLQSILEIEDIYFYHIPFLKNYGVGGIELASGHIYNKSELLSIRNKLLPYFLDRISNEINSFENYNIRKHALKSAVSSIMARNLSHIHGSHIEPGLQNKMEEFKNSIISMLNK